MENRRLTSLLLTQGTWRRLFYYDGKSKSRNPLHKCVFGCFQSSIFERYGLKVSSLYIEQVKDRVGINERINNNIGSGKSKVPTCPIKKEHVIVEAFKFFGMM